MGRGPAVFFYSREQRAKRTCLHVHLAALSTGLHRECLHADAVQMGNGKKIGPAAGAGAKVLGIGMGFDPGWIISNQITGR